ncbi:MAG: hypothetical protein QNK37_38615 [Acidobacteriota bacterium]|nr:hypothetical protein [Acidobacteriota bacterium]
MGILASAAGLAYSNRPKPVDGKEKDEDDEEKKREQEVVKRPNDRGFGR